MNAIQLPAHEPHRRNIEIAWGQCMAARRRKDRGFAEKGLRLARARDARFLRCLEKMAEEITKIADEQYGRTRRDPGTAFSHRVELTEATLAKQAYTAAADGAVQGPAVGVFEWIFGAAAWLAVG